MMILKTLLLTLFFTAIQANASQLIRIDSKNDLIKQIAVTGDETIYGVGTDEKLYTSHNFGNEWTLVASAPAQVKTVKVALTGEAFVTVPAGQTFISRDLNKWEEISAFSGKGMVILPTGETFDIREDRDNYRGSYDVLIPGKALASTNINVTTLDVFGSNDQTLCEIALISGKNYNDTKFGNIICHLGNFSWALPGAYLKAAITADGETIIGLKQDGSIEKITLKDPRIKDEATSYEPKKLSESEVTRETISNPNDMYRDVTTGVFGRAYGLATVNYPHLSANQLVFQHISGSTGEPSEIHAGFRLDTQMKYMQFSAYATMMDGNCKAGINAKSKRYEIVCSDGYRGFIFTALNRHVFEFGVTENSKVIIQGTVDLN